LTVLHVTYSLDSGSGTTLPGPASSLEQTASWSTPEWETLVCRFGLVNFYRVELEEIQEFGEGP